MGARSRKTKEGFRNPTDNAPPLQDEPDPKRTRTIQPPGRQVESDRRRTGHIVLAVKSDRTKLKHAMKTNDKNTQWKRAAINTTTPLKSAIHLALPKSASRSPLTSPILPGVISDGTIVHEADDESMDVPTRNAKSVSIILN